MSTPPPPIPPFRAVLFDGDGVVFDSERFSTLAFIGLMAAYQLHFTAEDVMPFIGVAVPNILTHLEQHHGLRIERGEYERQYDLAYRQVIKKAGGLQRMEGIERLLAGLRLSSIPWALATSASAEKLAFNFEQTGLAQDFPVWVLGSNVPRGKPAPDIFVEAARRLGVLADQCIVVEDSVAGLRAGKSAGAAVVAIRGSHRDAELLAETPHLFDNPGALATALERSGQMGSGKQV